MGGQERAHANFATRVSYRLSRIQVTPFGILQGITGVGLIITGSINVFGDSYRWLLLGIVLYLIALGYAIFVQTPTVRRVIEMTTPPPGAPGAGGPPAGGSACRRSSRRGTSRRRTSARADGPHQARSARRHPPRGPHRHDRVPDGGQALLAESRVRLGRGMTPGLRHGR